MQLVQAINVASQQLVSADGGANYPVGDYPAILTAGTIKPVKDKPQCGFIEYTGQFIDGPLKGASFPWRFNVYSDSQQACEIATRALASLGACVGVMHITDTDMLLNKPFIVCIRPRRDDATKNEAAGAKDVHGNDPVNAGRGPQAPHPAGPQGGFGAPAPQPQGFGQPQGPAPAPAAGFGQPAAQQGFGGAAPAQGFGPAPAAAAPAAGFGPAPAAGFGPAPGAQPGFGGGQPTQQAQPAAQQPAWAAGGGQQPAAGGQPAWAQQR